MAIQLTRVFFIELYLHFVHSFAGISVDVVGVGLILLFSVNFIPLGYALIKHWFIAAWDGMMFMLFGFALPFASNHPC